MGSLRVLNAGDIINLTGGSVSILDGEVEVGNGKIIDVNLSGPITAPSPTTLRLAATGGIDSVSATSIQGRIVANAGGSTGTIKRLTTTSGEFAGTLEAFGLESDQSNPGVSIAGQLTGRLVFGTRGVREPIATTAAFASGAAIVIGGDLRDDATDDGRITLPASGLQGQVIINASNVGGAWAGNVTVGTTTLAPIPNYDNLSPTLGGGAVGVVPFNCHQAESTDRTRTLCPGGGAPQIGVRTWPSGAPGFGNNRETVVVHHYGPLQYAGSTLPFVVERQSMLCELPDCPPAWEPLPTGHSPVIFLLAPSTVPIGQRAREVWLSTQDGTWPRNFRYRFTPASDANGTLLRSAGTLLSTAPPVASYTFVAEHWLCLDLNLSGGMDPGDLEAWFDHPVDVNDDAVADSVDMGIVADAVAGG